MKNLLFRKIIITITISVLLSLTFAPLVYSNTSEKNYGLHEITVEVYDINNVKTSHVNLTKQELTELKELIYSFKEKLDNIKTLEETDELFREMIVSLYGYNLFPKGLSLEEIQSLVTSEKISNTYKIKDRFKSNQNQIFKDSNLMCYIAFNATIINFFRASDIVYEVLYSIIKELPLFDGAIGLLLSIVDNLFFLAYLPRIILKEFFDVNLREMITFGETIWNPFPEFYPSAGWVWTNGLYGKKNWSGEFYGNLNVFSRIVASFFSLNFFLPFIGVDGFTGFKINSENETFFMGFATRVGLKSD